MTIESQRDKLKQHFAGRVTTQARIVLEAWQQLKQRNWQDKQWFSDFQLATDKLGRYAARFDMTDHLCIAQSINTSLKSISLRKTPVTTADILAVEQQVMQLATVTQRKTDRKDSSANRTYLRSPIYLALNQKDLAQRIAQQMQFFGFRGELYSTHDTLQAATQKNKPETMIVDVDFGGEKNAGIELIKRIQGNHETPIPVMFICPREGDIKTRLEAARCGGEEFVERTLDAAQLIEKVETYTRSSAHDPYRIMVVDDSRAQAAFMESTLRKAGMTAKIITDPMQVLIALEEFSPEIIIMDMYMPGCTGTELAKVIRQQDKFVSVPIIYLSAEDDINKQLHAMSLGGDDFLVKPINPRHLIATIHNRGRRARTLHAMMIRDSLTGLYNHTHTLNLLSMEINKANQTGEPLSFAMMDIDYFKRINDTHGHPVGDRVLKSMSLFLKQRLRKTDHIGRYGGEEFAVVLPNTDECDAKNMMNDIRERFGELMHPTEEDTFKVTFSCGIAAYQAGNTQQVLAQKADKALYEAKHAGRNCVKVFR
ncbi:MULTISPECIES: GGDEF domain-containing response regulator [unclassified Hahella]|uniref:GGDEF domain-containing response regulator n=1 Tax=unclassified Hahella TaxID=2624107 RepID=UPI001C1EC986|nr:MULTISPECIES: diguanylate cyclase [unclassified Hahella]MBU6953910.1 diguanylate cyclase [Hahella sp. HN01]MDG9670322.1 diguanylate cyclase [Hahella sp. CR1]